jgi:uncharacterized membrane protein
MKKYFRVTTLGITLVVSHGLILYINKPIFNVIIDCVNLLTVAMVASTYIMFSVVNQTRGRHGRNRMVIGFKLPVQSLPITRFLPLNY